MTLQLRQHYRIPREWESARRHFQAATQLRERGNSEAAMLAAREAAEHLATVAKLKRGRT